VKISLKIGSYLAIFLERTDSIVHLSAYEGHACLLFQQIKNSSRKQPLLSFEMLLFMSIIVTSIRVIFPDSY